MALVNPEHYPQIRAAIDLSLTAQELPATTIALPIYLGSAIAEVQRRDPAWSTRTGEALNGLRRAAIFLTAARLAPAIPQLRSESWPEGYSYSRETVDYAGRAAALLALAEEALSGVLEPAASVPFVGFTVASGRRGR